MSKDIPDQSKTSAESPPSWVNASLLQEALRRGGGEDVKACVQDVHVTRGIPPGENFSSVIYRADIELADGAGKRSLLVKTFPEGEAMIKSLTENGLFGYETSMLAKYIPAMKSLLDRVAPGRFPPFAPLCPSHGNSPSPYLVLEDLKPQGFRLAERRRGLGLRHSLLAIRTLARFHATSVALLAEDPSVTNYFPNPFRTSNAWGSYASSVVQMTADACKKLPGYEEYARILERIKPEAMEILCKMNDTSKQTFNVLLHGDFWTNNIMFKYEENGRLKDIRLVDFQIAHVASPAIDILYFLYTSLSEDISQHHETLLIREYHVALTETLAYFGLSGPSFTELMNDINEHGFYGVFASMGTWQIAHAEAVPDVDSSFSEQTGGMNFMYESAHSIRWMKRVLPMFKDRGWLDVCETL